MGKSKVIVTGMGMISALGLSLDENWDNLKAGKSGIGLITLFDPSKHKTRIAAQLPENFRSMVESELPYRKIKQMARGTQIGYLCSKMAWEDSGIRPGELDKTRAAVIIGATGTGFF